MKATHLFSSNTGAGTVQHDVRTTDAARQARRRKALCVFLCALICTSFAAAQSDEFGVSTNIAMILQFLASPWVTGLACIALIIEAILLLTAGRSEPGMFKKFVPWIAGTIVFLSAGTITSKFIGESLSDTSRFTSELGIEE